ncbi:hypothetical protein M8C21_006732 [Ambrosia artemisiifolia]|uniref:Uncharacterized protein n=1 Tax=Ambrosia artemisiifolia TaxID=4212 RepID=A0AAD5CFE1_AMBAR|nr:hypothetical protein M8C21_006732 [Ambrosia artemisiifolia]
MPSSHSATVTALAIAVGLQDGVVASTFATALILAYVVMSDVTGVRLQSGRQAEVDFSYFKKSVRWPTVGRYRVDVASFEVKEDTDLFVIDEVGKMELFSSLFFPAVLRVLESNKPFLATIPVPKSGHDIPAVARLKNHPGATVFSLTTSNRDAMKDYFLICGEEDVESTRRG